MGYDPNRFDGPVDDELKCPICCFVLQDAVQAPDCEHTFCSECIHEWLSRQTNCPVDRQPLTRADLKPAPRVLRNFLAKLDIKCDFNAGGCQAVVKLELIQAHCDSCDFNPYKPVICEKGCGLVLLRNQVDEHNCLSDLREHVSNQDKLINELRAAKSSHQEQITELKSNLKRLQDVDMVEQNRTIQNIQQHCNRMQVHIESLQKNHTYLQQQGSLCTRSHSPVDGEDDCDCDTCDPPPRSCLYVGSRKRIMSWKDMPAKRLPCSSGGGKPFHGSNDGHSERSAPSPYSESEILRHNYYHNHGPGSNSGHHSSQCHGASPLSPLPEVVTSANGNNRQQLITLYGQVITLSVSEDELVENVKAKIESMEAIPADEQLLFFAGQQLEDGLNLGHYNVSSDNSRHLVLRLRDGMKIYVKTLSDKTIEVQVDPSETIEIVKVKIHEQEGISPCDQRLLQDGRDLADLRTLSDYGIKHKSTLQLDLHLGGPCPICQSQFKNSGTPTASSPRSSSSSSGKGSSYLASHPHSGKHD
ncbi:E3 ubiquitin-protein ligase NRDP1 [Halotydeus destructor]|nr:E3 ubiquitin-protein ligase NRDP1 [Halotydeus destructor]KAI1293021.1 E3 ubiquitin-protein ligase NRDP1 [Halotydeus destructor]